MLAGQAEVPVRVGAHLAVHRGDDRGSLVLRVLAVDDATLLCLCVAVSEHAVFSSLSVRFQLGSYATARSGSSKRWDLSVNRSLPDGDSQPIVVGATADASVASDTVAGFGTSCLNCTVSFEPHLEFELDMRIGWTGLHVSNVHFFSGSIVDIAAILRFTIQGVANLATYKYELLPPLEFGPPGGFPFGAPPIIGRAKPFLSLSLGAGGMGIGAADLTLGTTMGFGGGIGLRYTEGTGVSMETRVLREPYVTPTFDWSVVASRSNPRIKAYVAVQVILGVKLWKYIVPYILMRAPELGGEWLFKTNDCGGGPGYRATLGLNAFAGVSLFPGLGGRSGRHSTSFFEIETAGGLPAQIQNVLPRWTVAEGCNDVDPVTGEALPPSSPADEVAERAAATAGLADAAATAAAAPPVTVDPIGETGDESLPSLPPFVRGGLVIFHDPIVWTALTIASDVSRDVTVEVYVRLCLLGTDALLADHIEPLFENRADVPGVEELDSCSVGRQTDLLTGPALGVPSTQLLVPGGGSVDLTLPLDGPLLEMLAAPTSTLEARLQVVVMESGHAWLSAVTDWLLFDDLPRDDPWPVLPDLAWFNTPAALDTPVMGPWSSCEVPCSLSPSTQRRVALCVASGDQCAGPVLHHLEERECQRYRCPVYPLAWSTQPDSTALPLAASDELLTVVTPATVAVEWTGGSILDRFEVDMRTSGCEAEDSDHWRPVRATIVRAGADSLPADTAMAASSWRAELSLPQLHFGAQTKFRVRPIPPLAAGEEYECTDYSRALVSPSVSIVSVRMLRVASYDSNGVPLSVAGPVLVGPGAASLVAAGATGSVSVDSREDIFGATVAGNEVRWLARDPSRISWVHLSNLQELSGRLDRASFPLTLVLASTPADSVEIASPLPPAAGKTSVEVGEGYRILARIVVEYDHLVNDENSPLLLHRNAYGARYNCAVDEGTAVIHALASITCTFEPYAPATAPVQDFSPLDEDVGCFATGVSVEFEAHESVFDMEAAEQPAFTCEPPRSVDGRSGARGSGVGSGEGDDSAVNLPIIIGSVAGGVCCLSLCLALSTCAFLAARRGGRRKRGHSGRGGYLAGGADWGVAPGMQVAAGGAGGWGMQPSRFRKTSRRATPSGRAAENDHHVAQQQHGLAGDPWGLAVPPPPYSMPTVATELPSPPSMMLHQPQESQPSSTYAPAPHRQTNAASHVPLTPHRPPGRPHAATMY
jgi:hypothetical protein